MRARAWSAMGVCAYPRKGEEPTDTVTQPYSTDLRKRPRASYQPREGLLPFSRPWSGALTLVISGLRFDLIGLPPGLDRLLALRFGPFAIAPDPGQAPVLTVRMRPAEVKGFLDFERQNGSKIYRLETRAHLDRLHAWSYAFAGWFEIEGSYGEITLCDSDVEPPARSIENFLRVAFAWKAAGSGGFLLHASGLVRNGKAHLFFGPSGSGKTTVTRLSPHDLRLNDDCIHVRQVGSVFCASGVPFKGADDGGAEHSGTFPIAGMYRLVQSRRVALEPMPAAFAVAEIGGSIPFVTECAAGATRNFETIERLVRSVPVGRLHFRLSPDFWTAIEGSERA